MSDAAKAMVWQAKWLPSGTAYSITGTAALDARSPGQWFQIESGLHYNWHRHYDPTIGRYTQPDPFRFVDGPSMYAYAKGDPLTEIDSDGLQTRPRPLPAPGGPGQSFPDVSWPTWPTIPDPSQLWDDFTNMCKRAFGNGGNGDDPDDEDCDKRYNREFDNCGRRRWKMTHSHFIHACRQVAADRYANCLKNGGKLDPDFRPEWGDADEEIRRNHNR